MSEWEGEGVGLEFKVIGYTGPNGAPCSYPIVLVPLSALKPHERVIEERVEKLKVQLVRDGVQIKPILVDSRGLVILDGHHRVEALKRLGAVYVAAVIVDYDNDECISVDSWRKGWNVTKREVRERGLKGLLYPPRTSRHKPKFDIPDVRVPLKVLKGEE